MRTAKKTRRFIKKTLSGQAYGRLKRGIHSSRCASVLPVELAVQLYGDTDKGHHGYGPYYQQHLSPVRYKRNLLWEIGVGGYSHRSRGGGSLRLWRDYFPRSLIVGLDIHDKDVELGPRVRFVQTDQNSPDALRSALSVTGVPNIIIDDGSHMAGHAKCSLLTLWPYLKRGSVYVIEDLHTSYWPGYGGHPRTSSPETAAGLAKDLVDAVQSQDHVFHPPISRPGPKPILKNLKAMHVYPGIVFLEKG